MVSKSCSHPGARPECFIIDPQSIRCVTASGVFVPADKLVVLSPTIIERFQAIAEQEGVPTSGYMKRVNLGATSLLEIPVPAVLYYKGKYTGAHKLSIENVANLGLTQTRNIICQVFGSEPDIRLLRLDWCLDIPDISVLDFALYCRLAGAQSCAFEKSRKGVTFYLRRSRQVSLLIYDRIARLRAIRDQSARYYSDSDRITRIEIQLKSKGLPFRMFSEIERYAELNLLSEVSFWKFGRKRNGLKPTAALAAEGLLRKIQDHGMQAASKMYPAQTWANLQKRYLVPASHSAFPNLNEQMKNSIRDWLNDRIRFPRFKKMSS